MRGKKDCFAFSNSNGSSIVVPQRARFTISNGGKSCLQIDKTNCSCSSYNVEEYGEYSAEENLYYATHQSFVGEWYIVENMDNVERYNWKTAQSTTHFEQGRE